jgi:L-iditol 2-dehydrogenase
MRMAVRKGADVKLIEGEIPQIARDQIRLKVDACGVCGTDLHINQEDGKEAPFGHEIAGTVIEAGPAVTNVSVGQKVVLESATACGKCDNCRNTRQELCTDIQSFFFLGSFGFADEMIAPAVSAIPCDDLSPDVACISEPLGVAIDMVRLADIMIDSNVLVMGPGPIGLMALALAKRAGARRVFCSAFPREKARSSLAARFGADEVIDPESVDLKQHDFGCGIDRVLVTTPPPTLNDAFSVACKGAIISLIGIGYGDMAECCFNVNNFHFKKLQLRASFASPAMFTPLALKYLREGVIEGEALISHRFGLSRITEAMKTARDRENALKVIVQGE